MHYKITGILTAFIAVITLGLFSVQSVAADSAPATADIEICVNVQQPRQNAAGWIEEVTWELRPTPGGTAQWDTTNVSGGDQGEAPSDGATTVCFPTIGVPNDTYQLWVKGDDTLAAIENNIIYPSVGPYMSSITLIEGDVNNANDAVNFGDVGPFVAGWGTANDASDLNEDGITNFGDIPLITGNWGAVPPPGATRGPILTSNTTASNSEILAVGISVDSQTGLPAGTTVNVPIMVTADAGEVIGAVQLDINAPAALNPMFTPGAGWTDFGNCTQAPGDNICKSLGNLTGGLGGTFEAGILAVTIPADCDNQIFDITLAVPSGDQGIGGSGTGYGIGFSPVQSADSLTDGFVSCIPTAVSISNTATTTPTVPTIGIALLVAISILGLSSAILIKRN